MVTLQDVIVGKQTKVDQQIVDTFRRSSELLNVLEFDDSVSAGNGSTLAYGYVQLKTPSPAGRRNINTEYTPGEAKKEQKDGELTEDELKQAENKIQELTDKAIEEVDKVLANKENEILSI